MHDFGRAGDQWKQPQVSHAFQYTAGPLTAQWKLLLRELGRVGLQLGFRRIYRLVLLQWAVVAEQPSFPEHISLITPWW
jgi:hypothetical protein